MYQDCEELADRGNKAHVDYIRTVRNYELAEVNRAHVGYIWIVRD